MRIFQHNIYRIVAMCLGVMFLSISTCSAIQWTETEYDDGRFLGSRRRETRRRLDPAPIQEFRQNRFGERAARQKKQKSIFGSTFFGPAAPHGANHSARSLPTLPSNPPVVKLPPETISSPFARFSSLVPTSPSANSLQVQAEENFHQGNYSLAANQAEWAFAFDNQNGQLYMFAAYSNIAAGNYEKSGRLFRTGTAMLDIEKWHEVFANAKKFYGQDDWAQHRQDLDEFCRENPSVIDARRLRGYLNLIEGDLNSARNDFEFVLSQDTNDSTTFKLLNLLASAQLSSGNPAAANTENGGVKKLKRIVNPTVNSPEQNYASGADELGS